MSGKTFDTLLEVGNGKVEGPDCLPWVRSVVALTVDSKLAIGVATLPAYHVGEWIRLRSGSTPSPSCSLSSLTSCERSSLFINFRNPIQRSLDILGPSVRPDIGAGPFLARQDSFSIRR